MNLIDTGLVPSRDRILVLDLPPSAVPLFFCLSFLIYKMKGLGVGNHKYHLVLTFYDSGNGIQETEKNLRKRCESGVTIPFIYIMYLEISKWLCTGEE